MATQANKQDTGDRAERAAVEGDYDAVVVGAGFGGLYALHRLREKGLSVIGFEAAPEVGGTWYWNRYPGVRCDVPSLYYSYTWSEELRREWRWSEKYAARREILDYAKYVADRFRLRDLLRFQTRVVSASFDEASGRWLVRTDRGDQIRARFCIMATGALSVPNSPKTPGAGELSRSDLPHRPLAGTGGRLLRSARRRRRHGVIGRAGDSPDRGSRQTRRGVPAHAEFLRARAQPRAWGRGLQAVRCGLSGLLREPRKSECRPRKLFRVRGADTLDATNNGGATRSSGRKVAAGFCCRSRIS